MAIIAEHRDIIDCSALDARLAALGGDEGIAAALSRKSLIEAIRPALAKGRDEIRRQFEATSDGAAAIAATSYLMDCIIQAVSGHAADRVYRAPNPTDAERYSIAAVGGYGRGELAPFSDIDLLFLLPYKCPPRIEQIVEYVLYVLWDLGLKVGYATRSIDESIRLSKQDFTIRTSILEARFLCGERTLFDDLRHRFAREVIEGSGIEFVEAKLAERNDRHQRMGDSRYVLEPNVKDGKGGLRDIHTLFWIAKYLYRVDDIADLIDRGVLTAAEAQLFTKAQNFLWTVRCHLHYLAGHAEERLAFDLQPEIGRRLGYSDRAAARGVERFMKHYFLTAKDVGDLTRIFCAALEAEHQRKARFVLPKLGLRRRVADGFPVEGDRLTVARRDDFVQDPVKMIRLFHVAQARGLDIHPKALRWITQNLNLVASKLRDDTEANRLFLEILTSPKDPETALRRLNEAGVFGRFIPDFGRVVAQMQYDMYHVYTVDEHSILAIGILAGIERGDYVTKMPAASEVVHKVLSRKILYLGLLLHDIAKGRGGDHSELGAEVAGRLGTRLGLTDEEIETLQWLVRHHLLMSHTAQRLDLDDPKTITNFTAIVQSPERLRLLYVLSAADMRATGPKVWTQWKAGLLRQLYFAAEEVMSGGFVEQGREFRIEAAKAALRERLGDWNDDAVEVHLGLGYPSYWLSCDSASHARHARMIDEATRTGAPLKVESRIEPARGMTEVIVYTADNPGLFSHIAGAMALSGATILEAKIFTLTNGMALDVFSVENASGGPFDRQDKLERLSAMIEKTLDGRIQLQDELLKRRRVLGRTQVFTVMPRVLIDNTASHAHTVIEVNGKDRPGLLYDVTQALTELGLRIASARIATFGERAIDVFYVRDAFGLKVTHEAKLGNVRERLVAALADSAAPRAAAPKRKRQTAKRDRKGAAE